jgi:hypothetical protein
MPTRLAALVARAAGSSKRTRLAALALITAAGAAAVVTAPHRHAALQLEQRVPAAAGSSAAPVAVVAQLAPDRVQRRIYPYSIVPGGVANREELAQAIKADKLVADHYADFDVDKARPVTVSRPRAVYVSYRKNDKVYWTRKKLTLAEGEILLTDGVNELRTRCANRISDTPMLPVAAGEPSQVELDASTEEGSVQEIAADGIEDTGFDGEPFQLKTFASMAVAQAPADAARASTDSFRFSQPGWRQGSPLMLSGSVLGASSSSPGVESPDPEASRETSLTPSPDTSAAGSSPEPAVPPASTETEQALPKPEQDLPKPEQDFPKPEQPKEDPSPFIPAPPLLQPELPHGVPEQTRPADVPEPATLWLGGVAGAAMLLLRRRTRRAPRRD